MSAPHFDRATMPVLVVEDDAEVRCLLEREIADLGHPVTTASEAEQALRELGLRNYAVVITDIRMPGMDGVQLTQHVKERNPDTEVILITGYASVDSASRAVRLGAADYLTKPFGDIARISQSLDRALELHCQRYAIQQHILDLEAHRQTLAQLLERLPMAVLLVDSDRRVLMSNNAAEGILEQHDGLTRDRDGRLQVVSAASRELRELLRRASRDGAPEDSVRVGGAVMLQRRSSLVPLTVVISPIGDVTAAVPHGRPSAALFISDPKRRLVTAEDLLCRLYSLTPTEARMATILMQGRSVEDVAGELEISTNTVRTHLKRVFSKTGTSRQGELISLLLSGPALLRLERDPG